MLQTVTNNLAHWKKKKKSIQKWCRNYFETTQKKKYILVKYTPVIFVLFT